MKIFLTAYVVGVDFWDGPRIEAKDLEEAERIAKAIALAEMTLDRPRFGELLVTGAMKEVV